MVYVDVKDRIGFHAYISAENNLSLSPFFFFYWVPYRIY